MDNINILGTSQNKIIDIETIIKVLRNLRISIVDEEYDLQKKIADILDTHGISYDKEFKLGPRNRVDFLIGGIAIEAKKGKPYSRDVIEQIQRYVSFEQVKGIILVIERNLDLPKEINGKPCVSFGLNKLWGIAL